MTDSPTILKARTSADLLAMLPLLAGGPLTRSVAIAPFAGKRTPAVLRHPLPHDLASPALSAIAAHLVGIVSGLGGCDAVVLAIYADEPFEVALPKYSEFEQALLQQFLAAGFGVKDTFCVASDGWACFDERERRELSEISESPLSETAPEALTRERRPDGSLPRPDPVLASRVRLTLDELAGGIRIDAFGTAHECVPSEPVDLFEQSLGSGEDPPGADTLARIILDLQTEGDFDRTIVQVMLGQDRAREVWQGTLRRRLVAAGRGERPIDLLLREHRRRGPDRMDDVADMLAGLAGPRPDITRIRSAIDVLSHAAAHAPSADRPMLLCVLAWLHWAIGAGTATGRLLEASSRIDPHHQMTGIVHAITLAVMLPQWIANRDLRDDTDPSGLDRALNRAARRRRRG
ncbi:DUF4192 family protein [Microbacterium sp. NEAU-LLC]|uniref:DUF4192 family protein n=1 Tax=Microbacterium helvum TaxID=2773713 RepID=A0ABR8NRN8_9MICO|nr:DUF4192 family protein [Microbacterium helvum]MBD3941711.1 DUF4192 family protein [Microbacterium helvum]